MGAVTLSDLCELIVDCKNRTPPPVSDGEVSVASAIGTPDIINGRISLKNAKRVTRETYEIWTRRAIPRADDLVLSREAPVGRVGRVEPGMKICLGQRTMLLRIDKRVADPRFMHYALSGRQVQNELHARASGSTVAHLRVEQVRDLPMPILLALPEQRAIAEVLGALDDKIVHNEKLMIDVLSAGRLFFEKEVQLGGVSARIGDLADLVYGKSLRLSARREGSVPVFGCTGQIGWHDTRLTDSACPVVGRKGANAGHVSWMPQPGWVIDTAFYARSVPGGVAGVVLYFVLDAAKIDSLISDSAIPGVNRDSVLRHRVFIPSSERMDQFAQQSYSLLAMHEQTAIENSTLADLRDTLLPQLLSGSIRVKDAVRTVEEVV